MLQSNTNLFSGFGMAKSFKDEPEYWLPTEFLAEEDLAMEAEILKKKESKADVAPSLSFPMEFPYEFDSFGSYCSALSSSGESVLDSAETESSDEEDFLACLTRWLDQSSIHEAHKLDPKSESKWVMAGSPESTLSGARPWSVSSNGSPSGMSPPMTPFGEGYKAWDLIYEAARQVSKLKMNEAPKVYCSHFEAREPLDSSWSHNRVTSVRSPSHPGFFETNGCTHNVPQMNLRYQRARLEQLLKQQRQKQCASLWASHVNLNQRIQSGGQRAFGFESGRCGHPVTVGVPQSAWPCFEQRPLHQSQQLAAQSQRVKPGMKTIVLSGSGVKRACAGTGVFLPRRYGNNPEPRKKVCSTAVLPPKLVHALNLSFEGMNAHQPHTQPAFNTLLPSDYEASVARRNAHLSLQKRMLQQENHELRLPQEWTY